VLKTLKQNNSKEINKKWKNKQKSLKQVASAKKLSQVEISPDHNDICDETVNEFDETKQFFNTVNTDLEDIESEETTAVGVTTINNLLSHMVMKPRKKLEIDHTHNQGKSENIAIDDDALEQEGPVKGIHYFTKPSSKLAEVKSMKKALRYDISFTTRRVINGPHRVVTYCEFMNFRQLLLLKNEVVNALVFKNTPKELKIQNIIMHLIKDYQKYCIHIPSWDIIFDMLVMMNVNKQILVEIHDFSICIKLSDTLKADVDSNQNWLKDQLKNLIHLYRVRSKFVRASKSRVVCKRTKVISRFDSENIDL
jgi:hypothetical protein